MQRKNFQKFCRNVKERRYLLIGTIAIVISFFTYYCFYIFSSARNIVFQDHFRYLEIADKVVNGRLDITYLWLSFSGHRSPINLLTFLLNAKYFHLNTLMEIYIGAIILTITSFVLIYYFYKSINFTSIKKIYFIIPIIFIIFSLDQWENIVFSDGARLMLNMLVYILLFILLNNYLLGRKRKNLVILLSAIVLTSILIGTGNVLAVNGTIIILVIIDMFINKNTNYKITISIIATSFLSVLLYSIGLRQDSLGLKDQLANISHHIFYTGKFITLAFSGMALGVDYTMINNVNKVTTGLIGLIIIIFILCILYIYFKKEMYRKTYIPLALIIYSILIIGSILLARLNYAQEYGLNYAMSSRYLTSTHYALIGFIWIGLMYIDNKKNKKEVIRKTLIVEAIILVLLAQILTNYQEWKITKDRKANFVKLQEIALSDRRDGIELRRFQTNIDWVIKGLEIIKKNNLNVFYKQ